MTKTQIWVTAFLGVFFVLFGIAKLTEKDEPGPATGMNSGRTESTNSPAEEKTPLALMQINGCTSCHGTDLNGSPMAPDLKKVKEHWDNRKELITYLRNPASYKGSKYIDDYKQKYTSAIMPSYGHLDVKELGKIADFLLNQSNQ
jgi:cytochrome c553